MYRRISICDIFRTKAPSTAGLPACLPVDCLVCRSIAVAVDGVCVFEYFKCRRINFASIWLYFSARFRSFAHFGIYLLFVFVFGIVFIFLLFHLLSLSHSLAQIYFAFCLFIAFAVVPNIAARIVFYLLYPFQIYYLSSRFVCSLPSLAVIVIGGSRTRSIWQFDIVAPHTMLSCSNEKYTQTNLTNNNIY